MKKIITLLVILLITFSINADSSRVRVLSIPVEFSSGKQFNIGFSTSLVNSTVEPENKLENISFRVSNTFDSYTTGNFYLYFQLFTEGPIDVVVTSSSPLSIDENISVHYENTGIDTASSFKGSSQSGEAVIIDDAMLRSEEIDGVQYKYPEVFTRTFNFSVPIKNISQSGKYDSTLTVTVRSN